MKMKIHWINAQI